MGTTLNLKLSASSFRKAAKEVRKYSDTLSDKTRKFVDALIERGITVAQEYSKDVSGTFGTHKMGMLVNFEKQLNPEEHGCTGFLIGMGTEVFSQISQGRSINSLLALEFGTAGLALEPQNAFHGRGGRGTNSTAGHANDLSWYVYVTENVDGRNVRVKKKLTAITPTRPLYHAAMEMLRDIEEVAKSIFATNKVIEC